MQTTNGYQNHLACAQDGAEQEGLIANTGAHEDDP